MDNTKIQYYLNHLPVEIHEALMELDSDQKWAVYIALTLEGQKYFTEIKQQFHANANTIDPILKSLVAGGLVTNKVKYLNDAGNKGRSYYKTTKLGLSLLDALYEVGLPPTSMGIRVAHQDEDVVITNTTSASINDTISFAQTDVDLVNLDTYENVPVEEQVAEI